MYSKNFIVWLGRLLKNIYNKAPYLRLMPPPISFGDKPRSIWLFFRPKRLFFKVKIKSFADSITIDQVFSRNEYSLEPSITRQRGNLALEMFGLYNRILSDGFTPIIIDCGGNIGCTALFFANTYPCARVVAIEPAPENYSMATENTALYSNIKWVKAGVACAAGSASLVTADLPNNCFRIEPSNQALGPESVALVTIDEILDNETKQRPSKLFIVKIDIEGSESNLFSSNLEWIDSTPIIYVELHDYLLRKSYSSMNFFKAMAERKREYFLAGEHIVSVAEQ